MIHFNPTVPAIPQPMAPARRPVDPNPMREPNPRKDGTQQALSSPAGGQPKKDLSAVYSIPPPQGIAELNSPLAG
jgi:hypothetical protein